jgi:lysyl-tRNA synthetase class II
MKLAEKFLFESIKSTWGLGSQKSYSKEALDLIAKELPQIKKTLSTYSSDLRSRKYDHKLQLMLGSRFTNDETIIRALRSNVDEKDFIKNPKDYLKKVVLGAMETDYYYQFEKEY